MLESKKFVPLEVTLAESNGSFDRMVRKFIRKVKEDGILTTFREKKIYRTPSERRRMRVKSVKR